MYIEFNDWIVKMKMNEKLRYLLYMQHEESTM